MKVINTWGILLTVFYRTSCSFIAILQFIIHYIIGSEDYLCHYEADFSLVYDHTKPSPALASDEFIRLVSILMEEEGLELPIDAMDATQLYHESITVGGVYSRETLNDICTWAACTVLLIAVLLLRHVTYKMAKRRRVTTQWTLNGALMTPRVVRRIS